MSAIFGIVDLFAGPGGLGEGFASLAPDGKSPFQIGISIENEVSAYQTLTLRAFLREYRRHHGWLPGEFVDFHAGLIEQPDWASIDQGAWRMAVREARCLELGAPGTADVIKEEIARLRREFDDMILIGGPPCQAYSLVGRARSRGKPNYVPENDKRHYLFREYIRILDQLRPAAFVMENVKGMLSSTVESRLVFEMLMEDLSSLGVGKGHQYELRAIRVENGVASLREANVPKDFVVRAEEFGVPQRRHRVIIIGIRKDLAAGAAGARIEIPAKPRSVEDVLGKMPRVRSGLSRGSDSTKAWQEVVIQAAESLARIHERNGQEEMSREFRLLARQFRKPARLERKSSALPAGYGNSNDDLMRWVERPELQAIAQHETRGHMVPDLERYLFAATIGKVYGYSPKAADFPPELHPEHRSWSTGAFNDRFRVQLSHEPSTTITSHISKDGHYFIHPDPTQCRSLTVREAARLQTFPDDYLFLGNRTQQYVQIGNAVPPWLARQIAELLLKALT